MNNITFHISQTDDIQQALAKGGVAVLASGGRQITICYTPLWLARCLARRYRASFGIVGDVLYTPTPAAFIGREGVFVKWASANGGWRRVVGVDQYRVLNDAPHNLRLPDPARGPDHKYMIPEDHPAYNAEWER